MRRKGSALKQAEAEYEASKLGACLELATGGVRIWIAPHESEFVSGTNRLVWDRVRKRLESLERKKRITGA